jgi:hypothetical protein
MTTQTFTLTMQLPFVCPACMDAVGYLFKESGVCLGCEIDWEDTTVLEYESREAGEWGAEQVSVRGVDL